MLRAHPTETWLVIVLVSWRRAVASSDKFFTVANLFNLLNTSSTNLIFAVGLLVVLIAGGIDISFAVAASVVQYVVALALARIGGGNWFIGLVFAAATGIALGAVNAALIYYFRIISIVVTIATFNIFFGLLMFFTHGVSIYNLPEWWTHRSVLFEFQQANGNWAELTLPVAIMAVCVMATWVLIARSTTGRQLYAFGDNPDGARRLRYQYRRHALHRFRLARPDGRHCRAGAGALRAGSRAERACRARAGRAGRRRSRAARDSAAAAAPSSGASLECLLISVTQNGLNLLGISPYAFKMIVGAVILIAISLSNAPLGQILAGMQQRRGA